MQRLPELIKTTTLVFFTNLVNIVQRRPDLIKKSIGPVKT